MEKPLECCILLYFLGLTLWGCEEKREEVAPPNVVIILADDQGWGDLSSSGNTNLETPHIDAIAANGASITHFYVSPVCSPTRAELLTGRYHLRSGVTGTSAGRERMDLSERTLANYFQEAGYATATFGKWHSGMQHPYHPNSRGFEEFYGFCSGHWGDYFSPPLEHNGRLVKGEGYLVDDFTNRSIAYIEQHKDKPFLLYLSLNTPHSPMQVPDEWWDKFKDKSLPMLLPEAHGEDVEFTKAALAMCENIDWNVGRVMDALEEQGLEENTIVIYLSDNGPNSFRWNGGMKGRKGSTDEGGVRSPFYIQWPKAIKEGREIDQIAGAIDLLPTLAELTGIALPESPSLDGISLAALLQGEKVEDWPDRLIFSHWNKNIGVRSQQYRLDKDDQLFDMVSDPAQTTPIQERQADVARAMIEKKEAWKKEMRFSEEKPSDPFPLGHADAPLTQMPARDGIPHGGIQRSNQFPNDSFFTHWTSKNDSITWHVEVLRSGEYEVEAYFTCPEDQVGSKVRLTGGDGSLEFKVDAAHDPPLRGMENDRVERMESYVKDFKTMKLGSIQLEEGRNQLTLRAVDIPNGEVMDLRTLVFYHKKNN
ncbi:arylsulfatase [Pleomorphovibrio marinus]|uniref:arylsulfatase n=1 Tax=Pleomorphovibrio marinus TaxID=2164132 RepID=UPI000E0C0B33|nr:arylsulfatase [Pleomorphovibrio marinus]